ncbi:MULTISPECIES: DUF4913 domain-containing protein [Micromonospora]|uniref:DUF4913 domain-containing protein n=1 Tax=Micromonospora yangpuensis TaxID=683228 RepID=A0A1C6V3Q2_9ACTN|nr:DUF4913 domain-containing protein [Micromonospora yangpuensis]GGM14767.1 hypothetical protein GCM10012279_36160 [Micromonospora yangpuensis]SCL60744.1 protein of unknown function [Micromonospora yangpuensis]
MIEQGHPPQYADPDPRYAAPAQQYADPGPQYADPTPQYAEPGPQYADPAPQYADPGQAYQDLDPPYRDAGPQPDDAVSPYDATPPYDDPGTPPEEEPPAAPEKPPTSPFILYLQGEEHAEALRMLTMWVTHLLVPIYAREVSSTAPWCARWWLHPEAVAQLYGLWMAWQELTGPNAGFCGPANWHRDYLGPVMNTLRDPSGPFAGCKGGSHRAKEPPRTDPY